MHKVTFKDGRGGTAYDSFDEVKEIAPMAPRFCERCGAELHYASYFDNLNRFTIKGYCSKTNCRFTKTPAMSEEAYEKHMLDHWTKRVKERAGFKCEMASPECGGDLHAHHIIPKKLDPYNKFNVENGMCLCAVHHKKIHSFM